MAPLVVTTFTTPPVCQREPDGSWGSAAVAGHAALDGLTEQPGPRDRHNLRTGRAAPDIRPSIQAALTTNSRADALPGQSLEAWQREASDLTRVALESPAGREAEMRRTSALRAFRGVRSWCAAALVTLAAVLVPAAPARAITGGQLDGSGHPFVAAIGQPDGAGIYFTGTAISPTVVLTAAHAVVRLERLGFTTARLTFDPVASSSSTWYVGTIHVDPAYDPANTSNPNDLAVIVLDAPAAGITPASLPAAGLLDQLASQGPRASFQMVGYGISRYTGGANGGGQPALDFSSTGTRELAAGNLSSVTPGWLRLQLDGGAAACIGDSGAPSLVDGSTVIAGVFILDGSLSGGQCQSQPWSMRVDTPSARAFLGQYVALP